MKKPLFNCTFKKMRKIRSNQSFEAWNIMCVKIFIEIKQKSLLRVPVGKHSVITTFYQKREIKMRK